MFLSPPCATSYRFRVKIWISSATDFAFCSGWESSACLPSHYARILNAWHTLVPFVFLPNLTLLSWCHKCSFFLDFALHKCYHYFLATYATHYYCPYMHCLYFWVGYWFLPPVIGWDHCIPIWYVLDFLRTMKFVYNRKREYVVPSGTEPGTVYLQRRCPSLNRKAALVACLWVWCL